MNVFVPLPARAKDAVFRVVTGLHREIYRRTGGRRRWVRRFSRKRETVTLEVEVGGDVSVVLALLNELDPRTLSAQRNSNGWTVQADVHRTDLEVVLSRLADRPDVTGVAAIS